VLILVKEYLGNIGANSVVAIVKVMYRVLNLGFVSLRSCNAFRTRTLKSAAHGRYSISILKSLPRISLDILLTCYQRA
jgi:hypothetical protein